MPFFDALFLFLGDGQIALQELLQVSSVPTVGLQRVRIVLQHARVLSKEVEVSLAIELDALTPNSLEHAERFGDVFLVGVDFHLAFLEVVVEARMHTDDSPADEVVGIGVLPEEGFLAWTALYLREETILGVVGEAFVSSKCTFVFELYLAITEHKTVQGKSDEVHLDHAAIIVQNSMRAIRISAAYVQSHVDLWLDTAKCSVASANIEITGDRWVVAHLLKGNRTLVDVPLIGFAENGIEGFIAANACGSDCDDEDH